MKSFKNQFWSVDEKYIKEIIEEQYPKNEIKTDKNTTLKITYDLDSSELTGGDKKLEEVYSDFKENLEDELFYFLEDEIQRRWEEYLEITGNNEEEDDE